MSLAVLILSYNEECHIARVLQSVSEVADEIFVIDSCSTDQTAQIVLAHGAQLLQGQFDSFSQKFQWALDHAPIKSDWIMRLDADEYLERSLVNEIKDKLPALSDDVAGVRMKRKFIFLERWIKHGGRYPLIEIRMWRRGHAKMESRLLDEHIEIAGGRIVSFDGDFTDHNLADLTTFTAKHNFYATAEAIEMYNQRYHLSPRADTLSAEKTSPQAALKRFVKTRLYYAMPIWLGPLAYFFYRYFLRLGFLDGPQGLVYHVLHGFWFRFLAAAKLRELEIAVSGLDDPEAIRAEIERRTGRKLS